MNRVWETHNAEKKNQLVFNFYYSYGKVARFYWCLSSFNSDLEPILTGSLVISNKYFGNNRVRS